MAWLSGEERPFVEKPVFSSMRTASFVTSSGDSCAEFHQQARRSTGVRGALRFTAMLPLALEAVPVARPPLAWNPRADIPIASTRFLFGGGRSLDSLISSARR